MPSYFDENAPLPSSRQTLSSVPGPANRPKSAIKQSRSSSNLPATRMRPRSSLGISGSTWTVAEDEADLTVAWDKSLLDGGGEKRDLDKVIKGLEKGFGQVKGSVRGWTARITALEQAQADLKAGLASLVAPEPVILPSPHAEEASLVDFDFPKPVEKAFEAKPLPVTPLSPLPALKYDLNPSASPPVPALRARREKAAAFKRLSVRNDGSGLSGLRWEGWAVDGGIGRSENGDGCDDQMEMLLPIEQTVADPMCGEATVCRADIDQSEISKMVDGSPLDQYGDGPLSPDLPVAVSLLIPKREADSTTLVHDQYQIGPQAITTAQSDDVTVLPWGSGGGLPRSEEPKGPEMYSVSESSIVPANNGAQNNAESSKLQEHSLILDMHVQQIDGLMARICAIEAKPVPPQTDLTRLTAAYEREIERCEKAEKVLAEVEVRLNDANGLITNLQGRLAEMQVAKDILTGPSAKKINEVPGQIEEGATRPTGQTILSGSLSFCMLCSVALGWYLLV